MNTTFLLALVVVVGDLQCSRTWHTSGRPPADLRQTSGRPPADTFTSNIPPPPPPPGALLRPPRVGFSASAGFSASTGLSAFGSLWQEFLSFCRTPPAFLSRIASIPSAASRVSTNGSTTGPSPTSPVSKHGSKALWTIHQRQPLQRPHVQPQ